MLAMIVALALQTLPPSFRVIDKGAHSGIGSARQVVVRTEGDWASLWQQHAMTRPRPEVDFSRDMVVAVFMGSRPTAGFSVEIVGVSEEKSGVVVRYREHQPAQDAITAQVLTSPYVIAAIPTSAGEVRFEKVQ